MRINSIYFRGHSCFSSNWAGLDALVPINVIIGRNNSGKSQFLDLIRACCSDQFPTTNWNFRLTGTLTEKVLQAHFRENHSHGKLTGNHWSDNGRFLINTSVNWELNRGRVENISFNQPQGIRSNYSEVRNALEGVAANSIPPFAGKKFRHLSAERNILAEPVSSNMHLSNNGIGATNIIRRYITSSSLPRELIQSTLLEALNEIFASDGIFDEIEVQFHDAEKAEGMWEIYLGEKRKGLIPLSSSGSGLKTIILVLLNLIAIPKMESTPASSYIFAFEELENNLHPSLLRRLLTYIETFIIREKATLFLTTHSSVTIDTIGSSPNAQIVHVHHNGRSATTKTASNYWDRLNVVSILGARPSDLLQANGIVWVEGPSDRIYFTKWIQLLTDDKLREGRDYQCAFFGGSLLARYQFTSPEDEAAEFANLLRLNPNAVVICDSDMTAPGDDLKQRVRRIREEVNKIASAYIWITAAKEIENYLSGDILAEALDLQELPDPDQHANFFPSKAADTTSYTETELHRKTIDKVQLAALYVAKLDKLRERFDMREQLTRITHHINSWAQR